MQYKSWFKIYKIAIILFHYGAANILRALQLNATTKTKLNRLHYGPDGPWYWFWVATFCYFGVFIP